MVCTPRWPATRGWIEQPASPDSQVELLLALRHPPAALRALRELVANVSEPHHDRYGDYMSADELRALIAPPAAASAAVIDWLAPHGTARLVRTGDFLQFQAPLSRAMLLFEDDAARLRSFEHPAVEHRIVRATRPPVIPAHIASHIEVVSGLCDFPLVDRRRRSVAAAMQAPLDAVEAAATPCSFAFFDFPTLVAAGGGVLNATLSWQCAGGASVAQAVDHFALSLSQGDKALVARTSAAGACGTPNWAGGNPVCQLGWEVPGLRDFARVTALRIVPVYRGLGQGAPMQHAHPITPTPWATPARLRELYNAPRIPLDGGGSGVVRKGSMAVLEFGGSFDPDDLALFARLHGEPLPNVTVRGRNNPANPDTENTMDVQMMAALGSGVPLAYWGYSAAKWLLDWAADVSDEATPPLVWSLSFGEPEVTADDAELERTQTELMKMAARGLTIVSTSGDWGASDNVNCSRFYADFPSSSPYTTSAGATLITSPSGREAACSTESGCAFTTGGGFSARWPAPSWQAAAVGTYLARVNASQKRLFDASGRGYNDVAAVGNNVRMVIGGALSTCGVGGGTSASGPIVGGLLALVNAARLEAGRPPLGLANPLLYATPAAINAVGTDGGGTSNQCASEPGYECCAHGLREEAGWDPLSGLGSINVAELVKATAPRGREGG